MSMSVTPIGMIHHGDDGSYIQIEPQYRAALTGLDGFGYIQVIWWASGCDNPESRACVACDQPYVHGPSTIGIFATRSPERPNPIGLSCAYVTFIDGRDGVIGLAWIDADEGTPVLDIKPYTPSLDRVEKPRVPGWCAHWPKTVEASDDFPWEKEFTFTAVEPLTTPL